MLWHRQPTSIRWLAVMLVLLISILVAGVLVAQDDAIPAEEETPTPTIEPTMTPTPLPTPTPTEEPAEIVVRDVQPTALTQGTGGILTITGENFTSSTTATLNGTIALPMVSQTTNTLAVNVGTDVAAGVYQVVVSDPAGGSATATDAVMIAEPTPQPQLTITQSEPTRITAGQSGTLSLIGGNFTANTTVRLVGYGFLQTTFVNNGALTATLPANLPAGQYTIEANDPTYGLATAPNPLTVVAAAVVATATPTPTPVPGQPTLIVRSFVASPASIYPGGTTQLTFEVVNVGTRTAEGVVVSLGNSSFAPSNGLASLTLPDLASYVSYTVTLAVTAPSSASEGSAIIPLVLSSRDFSGQTYTDEASLSVNILAEPTFESQVVLDSYRVTPDSALPGEVVNIQALFTNTGNETASQVLVQLGTTSAVLIAGSEGNSFPIGDLRPGASAAIVMPLVVASDAPAGIQSQSFTISYLQDGESRQTNASISLSVQQVVEESPVLLLTAYDTGESTALQPGQQFTYTMHIQNAGQVDVSGLTVTFGQSKTSSSDSSSSSSTNFAPLGSGDTVFYGDLEAGETAVITQGFIVNNDVSSGVYTMTMVLTYRLADGTSNDQTMSASLIVIVSPRLRITLAESLDDPLTSGESYTASIEITNLGSADATLTEMRVVGDNVTITEGAETLLNTLQSDDDTTVDIGFDPSGVGSYSITAELDYLDDLNRTQTITTVFSGDVEQAARPQMPVRTMTVETETTQEDDLLGRLLLGFLGFGG
ncbi:MAG: hypothetical protein H6672_02295 [Anaerolineaceae bacterium]|nr:hypothetical protein [Anaerolineaceae bacterium]